MTAPPDSKTSSAPRGRPRLGDQVYAQILRLIQHGEYPRHSRLPTEAEFGRRLGVSRPVVRHALARLRSEGYVESQQGSGTVVVRGPEAGGVLFTPVRSVADLQDCFDFRLAVEGESAALAAARHTPDTLRELEDALSAVDVAIAANSPELASDLNFRFHRAVAAATGNPYFIKTLESIPNLIGVGPIGVRNGGYDDPHDRLQIVLAEHHAICDAIRRRDAARACAEMQAHILKARQQIFERQDID